jgi:hypothetical protein
MCHDNLKDFADPRTLALPRQAGGRGLRDESTGGTVMQWSGREDRGPPRHYEAARVEVHCPTTDTHTRALILEHATIYTDGWASWVEDDHVRVGYVQVGRCCNRPEVHPLESGAARG